MFFYFDWTYYLLSLLLIPGLILSIIAQVKTTSAFNKNNKIKLSSVVSASVLARKLLDEEGLSHVKIKACRGELTDNFNPKTNTVSLSDSVFNNNSISAVGVMAHELGHVLQFRDNYLPVKIRTFLVPVINFSSFFMWPLTFLGIILEFLAYTQIGFALICVGIGIFALSTLFALITVPVEKDASRRAYKMLIEAGVIDHQEGKGVKQVLNAASKTYVAALITSMLSLLRFVLYVMSVRSRE